MVLAGDLSMSRTDEVHRITENVYKSIMEQFNPCLRNFVAMGKTYEKALSTCRMVAARTGFHVGRGDHREKGFGEHIKAGLGWEGHMEDGQGNTKEGEVTRKALHVTLRDEGAPGVTFAAKGYFDALVRMGELASESHGSKDLGDVLFQMAEVHRQIQVQLEEMLKSFHNELLTELEKKVELDARYLNAALKKYQMEHRSKGESLEKCQAELKRLRRKSQGSKNPSKYSDKEMQYVENISSKQSDLDNYIAEGYKTALSEERRRYCFLVERQCAVAKNSIAYHGKGKDLLTQKVPIWQQACSDPTKLPERALILAQQMSSGGGGTLVASPRHSSKGNLHISEPIPGAKPLPVPPELAGHMGGSLAQQTRLMSPDAMPLMNGTAGLHGADYSHWAEEQVTQVKQVSPQVQRQTGEVYSNTLPVRRPTPSKSKAAVAENRTLPRSSSMAAGLERNGRTRVQAIFSHAAGDNSTLLSFIEGDVITLLVPEARDGWHYGESEKTKMRGWFPFSYTRVIPETNDSDKLHVNLHHGRSSSTGNLLEREDFTLPTPDYSMPSRQLVQPMGHTRQRPYSMAMAGFPQGMADYESRFQTSSEGKLISTV